MRHLKILAAVVGLVAPVASAQTPMTTVLVASGLDRPTDIRSAPGDFDRLFIVDKNVAQIRVVESGTLLATPFIDLSDRAIGGGFGGGERGLLGLAFHPDYATNGYFYVNYTDVDGNTVVSRFDVTADPNVADPASEFLIIGYDQPFENHNGGNLVFGPDGYLYIGTGDGGAANDPDGRAQNGLELLGKMLRIDVDGGTPYAVPADNPFVGDPAFLDEIWAYGLRNPWRYTFDALTGDLWIADVGQNEWEEVNFTPASSVGGENYGWDITEASQCFEPPEGCDTTGLTLPVHEYSHSDGCSVTGGPLYRGCAMPDMQGRYFFGDYCEARVWSLRYDGTEVTDFVEHTGELAPGGGLNLQWVATFGEDNYGEMYVADIIGGEVFKIVPDTPVGFDCNANSVPDGCDIEAGTSLDCNGDNLPDECLHPLDVNSGPIVAGGAHTFRVTCGTPGATAYFAGSGTGLGTTPTPWGDLGLDGAFLLGSAVVAPDGTAEVTRNIRASLAGAMVAWQVIEDVGNVSDIETTVVE